MKSSVKTYQSKFDLGESNRLEKWIKKESKHNQTWMIIKYLITKYPKDKWQHGKNGFDYLEAKPFLISLFYSYEPLEPFVSVLCDVLGKESACSHKLFPYIHGYSYFTLHYLHLFQLSVTGSVHATPFWVDIFAHATLFILSSAPS